MRYYGAYSNVVRGKQKARAALAQAPTATPAAPEATAGLAAAGRPTPSMGQSSILDILSMMHYIINVKQT